MFGPISGCWGSYDPTNRCCVARLGVFCVCMPAERANCTKRQNIFKQFWWLVDTRLGMNQYSSKTNIELIPCA